jgi:hypothetical protein
MQGFNRTNPTFGTMGASTSKANTMHSDTPEEGVGNNKTNVPQLPDSNTPRQISSGQVIAANLFPPLEPHYAGPIAVVIIIGAFIYYGLYRFAGSGQQEVRAKDATGYPVTYHTNTQINYHYDTDGQKIETPTEKLNPDKDGR